MDPEKIVISSNIGHKGFRHPRCSSINSAVVSKELDFFGTNCNREPEEPEKLDNYVQCWEDDEEDDRLNFCKRLEKIDIQQTSKFIVSENEEYSEYFENEEYAYELETFTDIETIIVPEKQGYN